MISLVLSTQGNPIALKRTLDSFKNICSEFIIGSVCVFKEDEELIRSYGNEYNIKFIPLEFNYIYKYGFSSILNNLASHSTNDLCLYMNVSEVVDGEERAQRLITEKFNQYNCFAIDHASESHTWVRMWNKNQLQWSGLIHEEIIGDNSERNLCPYYIFRFKDTEKDQIDSLKSKTYDTIKEIVYFRNYMRLVENPELIGATSEGWLSFAKDQYQSMKERMDKKGKQVEAFETGNLENFLKEVRESDYFEKERFETSRLIEYQNSNRYL